MSAQSIVDQTTPCFTFKYTEKEIVLVWQNYQSTGMPHYALVRWALARAKLHDASTIDAMHRIIEDMVASGSPAAYINSIPKRFGS